MCPELLLTIAAGTLVLVLEALGFIAKRPCCPHCGLEPRDSDIRIKSRMEEFVGPGGHSLQHPVEHGYWQCPRRCSWQPSVLQGSVVMVSGYSLRQNANMFWHWARLQEAGTDELALECFLDQGKVVQNIGRLREVVAEFQQEENDNAQLGGVGIDVEVDEVCLRARWVLDEGVWKREWVRYLAAVERGSSKFVLRKLETRLVAGTGTGGGGALSNEELYA
jgi:hypothetical protein